MHAGYRVIDPDLHVFEHPDLWVDRLPAEYRDRAPRGKDAPLRIQLQHPEGHITPDEREQSGAIEQERDAHKSTRLSRCEKLGITDYFSGTAALAVMDAEGIDMAVNFPTLGNYASARNDITPKFAGALCRAYNEWIADYCKPDPKRLFAAAMIPLHDIDVAMSELDYAIRTLGLRAAVVRATPTMGRNHGDAYFEPLWAEIERLGIPLTTHDGYGSLLPTIGEDRYRRTAERRAICHPFEGMAVLMSLLFGGVFERHPKLQVAILEAGAGWVPFWCERLDSHAETFRFELRHLSARPSEYVKRSCYVSMEPDERSARYAIDYLGGASQLLFSCDYPHVDGKWPNAVDELLGNDALSVEEKRQILWDNPARLYGLGSSAT